LSRRLRGPVPARNFLPFRVVSMASM